MVFRRILLATDGSAHSMRAAELASRLAVDGQRTILMVLNVTPPAGAGIPSELEAFALIEHSYAAQQEALEQASKEILHRTLARIDTKALVERVRSASATGQPARAIVDYAAKHECDLIVIGTRGLGDAMSLILGSVAHTVTHHSEVPVLLVR